MSTEKRAQVAAQCKVVHHLATVLAAVYSDYAKLFASGHADELIEHVGKCTADLMETLGDILSGMDAVTKRDEWVDPIFKEAQRLWPSEHSPDRGVRIGK